MLTTSQLYDLVKAKKMPTRLGKRGGHYYETQEGKRVYVGRADPGMSQQLAHVLALTPHSGPTTQSPTGPVEVSVLPAKDQRKLALATIRRKRSKESPRLVPAVRSPKGFLAQQSARAHIKTQTERWPAFLCRNCGTSVVPHWGVPNVHGVQVARDPETGAHSIMTTQGKIDVAGEVLRVHVTDAKGKTKIVSGYDPEAAAKRLCPECSEPAKEVGRKLVLRDPESKLKLTREDEKAARARTREDEAKAKKLEVALSKPEAKRTPGQQKLVDQHQALESVYSRVAGEKVKAEKRSAYHKVHEAAVLAAEENEALEVARDKYRRHLSSQGVNPDEVEQRASDIPTQDLISFAQQQIRDEVDRAAAQREVLGKEAAGKRILAYASTPTIEAHMKRRREGAEGGEERLVYVESLLSPGLRRMQEEKRTERLRQRIAEKESKKKIKKGGEGAMAKSDLFSRKGEPEPHFHSYRGSNVHDEYNHHCMGAAFHGAKALVTSGDERQRHKRLAQHHLGRAGAIKGGRSNQEDHVSHGLDLMVKDHVTGRRLWDDSYVSAQTCSLAHKRMPIKKGLPLWIRI